MSYNCKNSNNNANCHKMHISADTNKFLSFGLSSIKHIEITAIKHQVRQNHHTLTQHETKKHSNKTKYDKPNRNEHQWSLRRG